jgi:hypothetical protein
MEYMRIYAYVLINNYIEQINDAKSYKVIIFKLRDKWMKTKVPKLIKQQVIKQWLQGMSRDQIAKDNDIGDGTVSSIIKDAKQEIPDVDLEK